MIDEQRPVLTEEHLNAALHGLRQVVRRIQSIPGRALKVAPSEVAHEAAQTLGRPLMPGERAVLDLLSTGACEQWGARPTGDLKRLNPAGLAEWYRGRIGRQ